MKILKFFLKYLRYQLFARHKGGHGIHSPFVFELLTEIIEDQSLYYAYFDIAELRYELLTSRQTIQVRDAGAGSQVLKSSRKVKNIIKHSSIRLKHGELLFRLVNHFQPRYILELGTSVGISALYLAAPSSRAQVHTIEACPETAKIARQNFQIMGFDHIELHTGLFDQVLPRLTKELPQIDFVFFDGNHQKQPTLNYFEQCLPLATHQSVFVFDDIHWSDGMEAAWKQIISHPKVTVSIDLFSLGIVFFRPELQQQNFVIRY